MTIRELADLLIRSISGGNNSSDTKYEGLVIEALIPHLRERAVKLDYYGSRTQAASRRIDYALLNPQFTVTKDQAIQPAGKDYIVFAVPKPLAVGRAVDGFIYVGKDDESESFKKLPNREAVSNAKKRGFLRDGKDIAYIWQEPYLEIYGDNSLEEVNIRMVCSDPLDAPGFDPDITDYPVTESILAIMMDLFRAEMAVDINKPADTIVDNADSPMRGVIAQNLRG